MESVGYSWLGLKVGLRIFYLALEAGVASDVFGYTIVCGNRLILLNFLFLLAIFKFKDAVVLSAASLLARARAVIDKQ